MQNEQNEKVPQDLRTLADLLDSKFLLPFGIRVGWDGIIGLIPGFGGLATTLLSCYIIARAVLLGVSIPTLLRMGLNVLIDNGISIVPIAGWIGDFFWRSNVKNIGLIERHARDPRGTSVRSGALVGVVLVSTVSTVFFLAAVAGYIAFKAVEVLWELGVSRGFF